MYKVTMLTNQTGEVWAVMDQSKDYNKAKKALQAYRDFLPERKFRLEVHTVTVLDD